MTPKDFFGGADTAPAFRASSGGPCILTKFTEQPHHTRIRTPHTMAKRKSKKDPEELPDAPESGGKGKRKNADSDDSDSVRSNVPRQP